MKTLLLVVTIFSMVLLTACAVETTPELEPMPEPTPVPPADDSVMDETEEQDAVEEEVMDEAMHDMEEEMPQQYANNMPNDMEADVTITVEGGVFYFEPNVIEVNQGDVVRIIFENVEGVHDFVIPELDVGTSIIETGETETITFVAESTGTFAFLCTVGQHAANGMIGELIVA